MPLTPLGNIRGPQGIPGPVNWPLLIPEIGTTPPQPPPAGHVYLYAKGDHNVYLLDSGGIEMQLDTWPPRYG